jgi:preprotein translocase subunit SecA
MNLFSKFLKILGDPNEKALKKIQPLIDKINSLEKKTEKFSDDKIKLKTEEFKKRIKEGEKLNAILPEAFAVAREAAKRVLDQRPYDTQLIGGIALHQGKIAEMKTGEGKTLAAVLPIYLNALEGKGVHLVTVNDYLARRDTNWMGAVYDFLGLSIGCIQNGDSAYLFSPKVNPDQNEVSIEYENLTATTKKQAYSADITYGTNNEFGFDYLRDNMVVDINQMSQVRDIDDLIKFEKRLKTKLKDFNLKKQREASSDQNKNLKKDYLNFAIVDEVDSILIDESRTPLIISAPDTESAKLYQQFAKIVPQLTPNKDYNIDEKMQAVTLSDKGVVKIEKMLNVENLYDSAYMKYVHHLHQALKAYAVFKKDKQYMVKDGEVLIVDEFTGRVMPGRRFSEGLHQALEAKEGVKVQRESKTLATITFQNFFRLYKKLAGMTGTALTSAEEFSKVYSLDILTIPTNKALVRKDYPDQIFKNERGKFNAITQEIKKRNKKGQPALVGTVSVEKSEKLAKHLDSEGLDYEILNAKNHEREAQIIQKAGQKKAITIATNMAGRGTDIKLGKGVKEAGGLFIVGTERHEARRIDNQLRGRAGRQGDPGSSQFYISLEDELMRRFASDKLKALMDRFNFPEDYPIQNPLISRQIEQAQKRIEGYNFDIRKHVLEYDDVINRQREAIYQRRRQILLDLFGKKEVKIMIKRLIKSFVDFHTQGDDLKLWNIKEIKEYTQSLFRSKEKLEEKIDEIYKNEQIDKKKKRKKIINLINNFAFQVYDKKEELLGEKPLRQLEKIIMLKTLDNLWMEHLDNMQFLREGVGLRGYGQRDPLIEYKREGFDMYQDLLYNVRLQSIETLFKAQVQVKPQAPQPETNNQKENQAIDAEIVKEKPKQNLVFQGADANKSGLFQQDKNQTNQTREAQAPIKEDKVGRNEPCPCGSGKKYKKCCGRK